MPGAKSSGKDEQEPVQSKETQVDGKPTNNQVAEITVPGGQRQQETRNDAQPLAEAPPRNAEEQANFQALQVRRIFFVP